MDNLQYTLLRKRILKNLLSFKPYYKWITFNTNELMYYDDMELEF